MDLTRAGAVAEMHIYQRGRHGFGGGFGSPEFSLWMDQLKHFLDMNNLLALARGGCGARHARGGQGARANQVARGALACAVCSGRLAVAATLGLGLSLSAAPQLPKTVNDGYGDFLLVPAGRFTMGDTFGDGYARERPVHQVELDALLHRQGPGHKRRLAEVSR